jgi:hypothetical protein
MKFLNKNDLKKLLEKCFFVSIEVENKHDFYIISSKSFLIKSRTAD